MPLFSQWAKHVSTCRSFSIVANVAVLPPAHDRAHDSSPHGSPALTEDGQSATTHNSSPQTPSKPATDTAGEQNTTTSSNLIPKPATMANPPAKRKRLTPAEKEARDKEAAEKKKEREEKAAAKAEEKAARDKEREEKKKHKEEEDRIKAQEREEKRKKKEEEDKIKAQKAQEREEKKRKKEEEHRQIQEAKEKEARKQKKLNSFFGAPSTPKKAAANFSAKVSPLKISPAAKSSKPAESEYRKLFKPFFVKENTEISPPATQMDEETKNAKSAILDEFIKGERTFDNPAGSFDAVELFALPEKPEPRGRLHHPVKHIMENVYKEAESSGADGANKVVKDAREKLRKVPMKVISFSQDVRPPYYGTVTFRPFVLGKDHMRRLARMSTDRRLPLDYEYDSEAEWQEEEGEDLDVDDDEEEIDDDDDMDGFLDDSEDAGPARRIFINTMEPESSGICFENERRQGPNQVVYQHKMEIIIGTRSTILHSFAHADSKPDNHNGNGGLDPWSTAYWEQEPKQVTKQATEKGAAKMPPPPAPANALAALAGAAPAAPTKLVKTEIMNDVKKAILDNKLLSKVGIVDFVFQQFRNSATRAEVKNTIELVAEKQGSGRTKEWTLKPEHGISA